jgi:hypothetical protein
MRSRRPRATPTARGSVSQYEKSGTKECEGCGSIYQRFTKSIPMRDDDRARCEICGKVLEHWSGGYLVKFQLLTKG